MVKVSSPKDIIPATRFLILIFETHNVHHEGDERSRTNPGHGYPAYDEKVETVKVIALQNEVELEAELQKLFGEDRNRKDFTVIKIGQVVPVSVSLKIDLKQD